MSRPSVRVVNEAGEVVERSAPLTQRAIDRLRKFIPVEGNVELVLREGQVAEIRIDAHSVPASDGAGADSTDWIDATLEVLICVHLGLDPCLPPTQVQALAAYVAAGGANGLEAARRALRQGPAISGERDERGRWPRAAAAAFADYLVQTYGIEALVGSVMDMREADSEAAWLRAYQRPLVMLEDAWRRNLKRESGKSLPALLRQIWPYYQPYRWQLVESTIYIFAGSITMLFAPLYGAYKIADIVKNGPGSVPWIDLGFIVAALMASTLASFLLKWRRGLVTANIHESAIMSLQVAMFGHIQRLSHRFFGGANSGDLAERFNADVFRIRAGMEMLTGGVATQVWQLASAGVTLLVVRFWLGLGVIVTVAILGYVYPKISRRMRQAGIVQQALGGEVNSVVLEAISMHSVISAYGLEGKFNDRVKGVLSAMKKSDMRLVMLGTFSGAYLDFAFSVAQVVAYSGAVWIASRDPHFGTQEVMEFLGVIPLLVGAATALGGVGDGLQSMAGAIERVTEVLDEPVDYKEDEDASLLAAPAREITFEGVSFGYVPGKPILKDLSFRVAVGEKVTIVGASGCGKSTIAALLLRFYRPESGAIRFDDQDIALGSLESLRGHIGFVAQDTFAFNTTILQNILMGKEGATDEEVRRAVHDAELESFVATLPDGLNLIVGERGGRLSGGQRQRIAIARAILRNPSILILDEATSALDPATEASILDTFDRIAVGRTTITITHRLGVAARSDRILVLDGGVIVESGSPAELLAAGGAYARMVQAGAREGVLKRSDAPAGGAVG